MGIFKRLIKQKTQEEAGPAMEKTSSSVFCECRECEIQPITFVETAPMTDGHWTQFEITKCKSCGKFHGFPNDNMLDAIAHGTPELLDELRKLGMPIDEFRKRWQNEHEMDIDPSER